jgi:ornithine cyclodeaminase/alanine dehydrogenase-like protein (mu-crystallin family)
MDSTLITAFRTGAVSGLATKYLAREDVRRLGVLGSGAQSIPQIQAVAEVRGIEKVFVYSPNLASKKDAFLAKLRPVVSADVEIGASAESVVRQAEVLVLCSNSSTPILQGEWVQDGTCILAIGNASPNTREVDGTTVVRSRVVCDSFRACLMEAGDLLIPLRQGLIAKEHFQLDLGEIIESPERHRRSERDITLFKSVGLGFQDIVAAAHVYSRALARGAPLRDFDFFEDCGSP